MCPPHQTFPFETETQAHTPATKWRETQPCIRGLAVLGDPIGNLPFEAKIGCHFKNISIVLGEEHDLDQETLSSAEFLRCIEL
jgi:hypothetical protein